MSENYNEEVLKKILGSKLKNLFLEQMKNKEISNLAIIDFL